MSTTSAGQGTRSTTCTAALSTASTLSGLFAEPLVRSGNFLDGGTSGVWTSASASRRYASTWLAGHRSWEGDLSVLIRVAGTSAIRRRYTQVTVKCGNPQGLRANNVFREFSPRPSRHRMEFVHDWPDDSGLPIQKRRSILRHPPLLPLKNRVEDIRRALRRDTKIR